jgi:hypothetical protein
MGSGNRWTGLGLGLLVAMIGLPVQAQGLPATPIPLAQDPLPPVAMPLREGPVHHDVDAPLLTQPPRTEEHCLASGLLFWGDYLIMHPRRNALDYAIASPTATGAPTGSVQSLDWETRSGFRFGFGYQRGDDPWQVGVSYTYLHSSNNQSMDAPVGGLLFATLSRAGSADDVAHASASTNLDYNVIDLDVARLIAVNSTLQVKLFGGARFAWIDQKLDAIYNGGSGGAINDHVSSPVYFHGAGVTAGGEAFWKMWESLGVYGRARGSLLTGQFRNFLTETDVNGAVTIANLGEKYYQVVPVTELGLGVAWQGEHLRFGVGYEISNWFGMVNSPDFTSGVNRGKLSRRTSDLSIEGLAVQLGLLY